MEPQAECMLVLIGATPEGKKELLGFQVGMRESTQSWRELLVDLKARGLAIAPELATGDGALGFWKALEEVSPTTRHQRCTVHKTANVLDKLPKSVQPAAKADLREIWAAPDRTTAEAAIATFAEKYGAKYEKAVDLPGEGPRRAADLLRLPGRALGPSAHIEPDRERVCHRPAPDGAHQGRAVAGHRTAHGVQAGHGGGENLAPAEGRKPVAQSRPGRHIPKRRRGHRHASTERRLITASPKFRHSSRLRLANRDVLVVTRTDLIASILRDRPDGWRRLRKLRAVLDEMGPPGLFAAEGDPWRRQRRLVASAFAPGTLKRYFSLIERVTERLKERLDEAARRGEWIDLQGLLMRYTVDVTASLAFGIDVNTVIRRGKRTPFEG